MDLLEGSRSTMEGEREAPLYFGRAEVKKKRQRTIGEEGEGYKYPPAPNGHLSHDNVVAQMWQCLSLGVALLHQARQQG